MAQAANGPCWIRIPRFCRYDKIVSILEEDIGVKFTPRLVQELADGFLSRRGHLYTGAHQQNLPWMVAYWAGSLSLFGRTIDNDDLKTAISKYLPQATASRAIVKSGV